MTCRPHDEAMAEQFRADPDYAAELLIEVRRNGDSAELAILLRQMAKVFGQDEGWSLADAERKPSST
ncbi:transcriptional regulator [Pseudomonas sp. PDM03]|uniref:transcriptional regulator n=1 Tax=Pseudomonas sp. PDM03 TaxID=2769266 RepID=UPI00177F99FE|nr:transcriptional regulator [Pseudomonas sp. PDM03]MBD9590439.1 transcriptional regulator [Pseudomonas sp. PDM03]